jgi:hypothetical protein
MKWLTRALAAGLVLAGGTAWAQDDFEAVKKRILDKLEVEIKAFYQHLDKELKKVISEELSKLEGKAEPAPKEEKPKSEPAPKKEEPPAPAPAPKAEPNPEPKKEEPPKTGAQPKKPGYLGVVLDPMFSDEARAARKLKPGEGVLVETVRAESPAEKGGLAAGMVILKIDGETVAGSPGMRKIMEAKGAGDLLKITVQTADGKIQDLEVTLVPK